MNRLYQLLQYEPAALGSTVASILPALMLLGVVSIDEYGIAALVVAVNALAGFVVRLCVVPSPRSVAAPQAQPTAPEPAPSES
jgi:hypothetical protein